MNPRVMLALAVSAGMALIVAGVFYQIAVRDQANPVEQVALQEVVVAAKELNTGATIEVADLRVEMWPSTKIPSDAFFEIDELLGRVPINKILADEPVVGRRLADPGSGFGLAPKVPPGMRAMSVRVNDVIGVSGFVLPEARVDVLVTGMPRGQESDGQMTKTILGNVRVISAGENLEPDASGKPQRVAVVTLLVTPHQAELLTLATSQGRLQLVLRNSSDEEVYDTDGVREPEIFRVKTEMPKPPAKHRPRTRTIARIAPPPPPPPVQLEIIRGNERSMQAFDASTAN
ncbi:MAG: Flp pilus assembly protein CpaB [Acidobacteria bacterium]|nr:Flp pilus assembly protein CpaB [Acidobacteriota bacterium]